MARSEARLSVTIWDDDDFLALSLSAQRMFMFLISQVDLAHDGVIALRERRWSKRAAGLTVAQVARDLEELSTARFVVVDEDAEELLVRSFIRRDKVYRQPNVLRAAADHLPLVTSPRILAAIAAELRRVASAQDIPKGSQDIVAEMLAAIGTLPEPPPEPFREGSANPATGGTEQPREGVREGRLTPPTGAEGDNGHVSASMHNRESDSGVSAGENPSGRVPGIPSRNPTAGTPGERGVVTVVSNGVSPYPVPRSPGPVPRGAPSARPARERARRGTRIPDDFAVTDDMKTWFAEHCAGVDGPGEHAKFLDYWRAKTGQSATKLDWPATWRNWMRTAAERTRGSAGPRAIGAGSSRPSTTDQRVADGLALATRFDQLEAS